MRNLVMINTIIVMFLGIIAFKNNIVPLVINVVLCVVCFFAAVFSFPRYLANQYKTRLAFGSLINHYTNLGSKTTSENNSLFNALLWAGDIEGINRYLQNNGLSIVQNISYELFMVDKSLFVDGNKEYAHMHLKHASAALDIYCNSPDSDDGIKKRFSSNILFFNYYLNEKYTEAIKSTEPIAGSKPVEIWNEYHVGKCYECLDKHDKAKDCYEAIRRRKGITRFHKWLGYNNPEGSAYSILMILLSVLSILGIVLAIFLLGRNYKELSDALRYEYGIDDNSINSLFENQSENNGVNIYLGTDSIVYCYYECKNGNYSIKKIYRDKEINQEESVDSDFFESARIIQVEKCFYKYTADDIENIVVTKTNQFDSNFIDTGNMKCIYSISVDDDTYYLIDIQGATIKNVK